MLLMAVCAMATARAQELGRNEAPSALLSVELGFSEGTNSTARAEDDGLPDGPSGLWTALRDDGRHGVNDIPIGGVVLASLLRQDPRHVYQVAAARDHGRGMLFRMRLSRAEIKGTTSSTCQALGRLGGGCLLPPVQSRCGKVRRRLRTGHYRTHVERDRTRVRISAV